MISGVHAVLFSKEPEALRAFFAEVLERPSVDAGEGWLIFALPPAELAIHPGGDERHELYLMCDDIGAAVRALETKGVAVDPVHDAGWGLVTTLSLPGGHRLGLYEPRHPTALESESTGP